ncbi:hypothetical protein [Leptolyngbya sp. FACHB-541]|uniref:hypothetical protein n=1 Tax=Leptolyngbya sp. FACHB-541 TaxID=2692810 RepID=UPI001686FB78|nr:hypothetical protein [Leptolyngbya sp. FACHB-541]
MPADAYKPPDPRFPSITCPQCRRTSYNWGDIQNRYCNACKQFHEEMGLQQEGDRLPDSDIFLVEGVEELPLGKDSQPE